MPEPAPAQKAAQERIHALLTELAEIVGPNGWDLADSDDRPTGKPTLWEWVTVCNWVDDEQQDWVTIIPASGMLTSHITGLLRDAERQHGAF